jgi:hypothetical protein
MQGLERSEKSFFESESFLIRYERVKTEDVTPSKASGGFLLAEWIFAHKGDKWFNQRRFTHPTKTKELLVEAKPNTLVAKGPVMLEWQQEFQSAYVSEFAKGGKIYQGLFYTRHLSLDAPKFIAKSNGADIAALRKMAVYSDDLPLPFLPDFLRENKANYRVLPTPQEVDQASCWLVEWPGMDRFWVDPKRGFAIPLRRYSWAPGEPLMCRLFRSRNDTLVSKQKNKPSGEKWSPARNTECMKLGLTAYQTAYLTFSFRRQREFPIGCAISSTMFPDQAMPTHFLRRSPQSKHSTSGRWYFGRPSGSSRS